MIDAGELKQQAISDNAVSHKAPRRPGRLSWARALPLLILLALLAVPKLLWLYHVEQGGRQLEAGLAWPEPRQSDTLPTVQDTAALERAVLQLEQAIRWRPGHAHAYQLLAEAWMARGEPAIALSTLETARRLEPGNPLAHWQAGLIYEQLWLRSAGAVQAPLLDALAVAGLPIGSQSWPYAELGEEGIVEQAALLQPANSALRHTLVISELTALRLLVGAGPGQPEAGARLSIMVEQPGQAPALVFERRLEPELAQRWLTGWADLSRWAGQPVTLLLQAETEPGAQTSYAWGELVLTTPQAALDASLLPDRRMRQGWRQAGLSNIKLKQRGDEARRAGAIQESERWYWRAFATGPIDQHGLYDLGVSYLERQDWQALSQMFEIAVALNPRSTLAHRFLADGLWHTGQRARAKAVTSTILTIDPSNQEAFYQLGAFYEEERALEQARQIYTRLLELFPDDQRGKERLAIVNQQG